LRKKTAEKSSPRAVLARSALGREGEEQAAAFLKGKGLQIIAQNVRSPHGEVDIVALDGETLVFTEVKTWPAFGMESLQYGINLKKQRRIIETAKYFLCSHREYNEKAVRFDVIFVEKDSVVHLVSAFMEQVCWKNP
jgi:putative endonuclease